MWRSRILGAMISVFTLGSTAPVLAADQVAARQTVTYHSRGRMTRREKPIVSRAAADIVYRVNRARRAIEDKAPRRALTQVERAERIARKVTRSLPRSLHKEQVWIVSRRAVQENESKAAADFSTSIKGVDALVRSARAGAMTPAAPRGNSVVFAEVEIPLISTSRLLRAAKHDLRRGDVKSADQALAMVDRDGSFMSSVAVGLLDNASNALARASKQAATNAKVGVQAELETAVSSLQKVEDQTQAIFHDDMQQLSRDTQALLDRAKSGNQLDPKVLANLWQRSEKLTDRFAGFVAEAWNNKEQQTASFELAAAELHLGAAEFDQLTAHARRAARHELRTADFYLNQAVHRVPRADRRAVRADREQVIGMLASLSKGAKRPTVSRDEYEKVTTDLGNMVRTL